MAAIGRLNPVTGKITMFDAEKKNPVVVPDAKKNDNRNSTVNSNGNSTVNRSKKVHSLDDLIKANRK